MKTFFEILDNFTAIQIVAAFLAIGGAVLFIYGLLMMGGRSLKVIFRRVVPKKHYTSAGNRFRSAFSDAEKNDFADALSSMVLLIALIAVVIILAHSR